MLLPSMGAASRPAFTFESDAGPVTTTPEPHMLTHATRNGASKRPRQPHTDDMAGAWAKPSRDTGGPATGTDASVRGNSGAWAPRAAKTRGDAVRREQEGLVASEERDLRGGSEVSGVRIMPREARLQTSRAPALGRKQSKIDARRRSAIPAPRTTAPLLGGACRSWSPPALTPHSLGRCRQPRGRPRAR
jgi:hypothetical protein